MADSKAGKVANIFDVARLAGVSHQTVSRVINNMPSVRPATKERVEQAIKQLNYSPSPAARALVTRRTRTIGLIAPTVADHGPTSIATHFNVAARAERYRVDTISTDFSDPASVREAVESLLRQRVDAVAIVVTDERVLDLIRGFDAGVPIVAAASTPRRHPRMVSIDQYRGARAAVRHLVELGHTTIWHAAGPETAPDARERVRGWSDELAAHRLEVPEVLAGDWTAASGYGLAQEANIEPGTAVFASNDQMAIGLISSLRKLGLSVPDDVSVVGFDDIPEAAFLYPPLTTVRQDFAALGQMLMQKALVAMEEPGAEATDTPLPTRLILRDSTRKA